MGYYATGYKDGKIIYEAKERKSKITAQKDALKIEQVFPGSKAVVSWTLGNSNIPESAISITHI